MRYAMCVIHSGEKRVSCAVSRSCGEAGQKSTLRPLAIPTCTIILGRTPPIYSRPSDDCPLSGSGGTDGRVNSNVVPEPGLLVNQIRPPCLSTIAFAI